jgi:hypothetical protein
MLCHFKFRKGLIDRSKSTQTRFSSRNYEKSLLKHELRIFKTTLEVKIYVKVGSKAGVC